MNKSEKAKGIRPVYACDFWCNFCRSLQCNFCRKCKLAVISLRFPQIAAKLHQVSNMFKTSAISRRQIAQKSPLVYTCNFYRELERDRKCTEKCDKNCTKNGMCKRALRNKWGTIIPLPPPIKPLASVEVNSLLSLKTWARKDLLPTILRFRIMWKVSKAKRQKRRRSEMCNCWKNFREKRNERRARSAH